jgi:hypothetical protein
VSMPAGILPARVEPLVLRLKSIVLSDIAGNVAELVSLLPGLFLVKSRGIDCRPGGMPRLVRQVDLLEDSVTNYVCLNKVNLRASPSEEVLPSKLSSLPSNPDWVFVVKMGVSGSHCQSFISSSPSK